MEPVFKVNVNLVGRILSVTSFSLSIPLLRIAGQFSFFGLKLIHTEIPDSHV